MTDKVQLFNPNDGVTGRDGGPYLDQVEAKRAEEVRAEKEGRKPDLENPPATAGQPLNTARQQLSTLEVNNLPSQSSRNISDGDTFLRAAAASEDTVLQAHSEVEPLDDNGASSDGVLPGGLMDTNPAAIGTGPFSRDTKRGQEAGLNKSGEKTSATKSTAKKAASASKRAAKKATPSKKASAGSSGASNAG